MNRRLLARSLPAAGMLVFLANAGCTRKDSIKNDSPDGSMIAPQVASRPDHIVGEVAFGSPSTALKNFMGFDATKMLTESGLRTQVGDALKMPLVGQYVDLDRTLRAVVRLDGQKLSYVVAIPLKPEFLKEFKEKTTDKPDGTRMLAKVEGMFQKCAIVPSMDKDQPALACEGKDASPLDEDTFGKLAAYLVRGKQDPAKPGVLHATADAKAIMTAVGGLPPLPATSLVPFPPAFKSLESNYHDWIVSMYGELDTFLKEANTFSADLDVQSENMTATFGVDATSPKSLFASVIRSMGRGAPLPADMANLSKGNVVGIVNMESMKAIYEKMAKPASDAIHKAAVSMAWDKALTDSFDHIFELTKSLDAHHVSVRMDGTPMAAVLSTPGKGFAVVEDIDLPFDSIKPLWDEMAKVFANKSLLASVEKAMAPKKLDSKFTTLPANVLPTGATGWALSVANPDPNTCKPDYKPMPMPCTFAIDYVLMPNGNNTQVVVASNIKPEDIKALVDRSVATAPGDKITAMIPADKPGFQIAMTLDYLEATMMLTPDGAPGQFVESFADVGKGDDLNLRFSMGVDKAFVLGYTKLYLQMMGGHGRPSSMPLGGGPMHHAPPMIH